MLGDISIQYPSWYLLLCVLLGAVYAVVLYLGDKKFAEQKGWLPYLLAFLRGTVISVLAILLLSPILKSLTQEVKRPIVVIAQDASKSMPSDQPVKEQLASISEILSEAYDVVPLSFGSAVTSGLSDSTQSESTDLSKVLAYVQDNYADQNLGAVILASDGIYNEGRDPRYVTGASLPLYSIAYGDTTRRRDISIKNVYSNRIAYLGDKFVVQVDLQAFNASASSTQVSISKVVDGSPRRLDKSSVRIDDNDFFTTLEFTLDADQSGVVRYRVAASTISDEVSTSNNYKDFYVDVLDSRKRILLVAGAPHPDLAAIKAVLTSKKNYEVTIAYADSQPDNIAQYNLVILHNLPSKRYDVDPLVKQLEQRRIPRLYVLGSQTAVATFNEQQSVVSIVGGNNVDDVQAVLRPSFSGYILDQQLLNRLTNYPPLVAPFGEYRTAGPSQVVFNQRIKTVDTDYPLLAFSERSGVRTGVLAGEGVWRWRLFNFMKEKNYDAVDEFLSKAVQYLLVKDDKRKFRASVNKSIYKETESIIVEAQLFNDSYEQVNDPDVFVKVIAEDGKEYDYTMSKTNAYYSLDAGLFGPGSYRYIASVAVNGKTLTQKGKFSVKEVQLESYDLTARHDVLAQLSADSGAKMYYPDQLEDLKTYLTETNKLKPVLYDSVETQSVLNLKWLFALLFVFLVIEWFCRRYFGYY